MLKVEKLDAWYDRSHVVQGLDFEVKAGEIVTLMGRNGAGKTSTLRAIMGLMTQRAGSVRFDGQELLAQPAHTRYHLGLAYVPEERLVFDNLTVGENLVVGLQPSSHPPKWAIEDMYAYFPRLKERETTKAGNLSGGEQQMLTLCRSLLCHPRVLLIDEPTEGLAPKIVEHLVEVMNDIARRGVAIILVEQKMTIALRIAERCLVMGRGQIVFSGSPDELRQDAQTRQTWLEVA